MNTKHCGNSSKVVLQENHTLGNTKFRKREKKSHAKLASIDFLKYIKLSMKSVRAPISPPYFIATSTSA